MKRHMSIKGRITLWYAALIVFICAAAMLSLFAIADYAQEEHCRKTLENATVILLDEMEVEHGIIEIDSDIDEVPGVYASLFSTEGELIYGRNRAELTFAEGPMRRAHDGEHSYMVKDTLILVPDLEPVWLRIYMAADLTATAAWAAAHYGFALLPLLAVLALFGGYRITSRAFRPVSEMSKLAASIAGGGDLSMRLEHGKAQEADQKTDQKKAQNERDELQALAGTLNGMLARLESAFERERQFTSDVAHELRTPLNAMQAQGEYALSCEEAAEKDEAVARMLQKNEEMRTLVAQLLMIARLDAGQMEMEDGVALAPLLEEIREDLEPVAHEKGIRMTAELEDVRVRGNRAMLMRAAVNLADNAIGYGREGGSVQISLKREEGCAVIRVTDDGCGMDAAALERVFDRFWRADSARTTPGTGIGLAIARAAVRAHGGEITAESEPGKGSRFTIRLPAHA